MKRLPRVGDLELEQDLAFERRTWKWQRVGWVAMALLILAALLGLFGGAGPLATATAESAGPAGLRVEYRRFERFKAPTLLRFRVEKGAATLEGAATGDTLRLWIGRRYLSGFQVEAVQPEPDGVEATPDRLVYAFASGDEGAHGDVVFHLTTRRIGLRRGRAGLAGRPSPVEFTQFVYP